MSYYSGAPCHAIVEGDVMTAIVEGDVMLL